MSNDKEPHLLIIQRTSSRNTNAWWSHVSSQLSERSRIAAPAPKKNWKVFIARLCPPFCSAQALGVPPTSTSCERPQVSCVSFALKFYNISSLCLQRCLILRKLQIFPEYLSNSTFVNVEYRPLKNRTNKVQSFICRGDHSTIKLHFW